MQGSSSTLTSPAIPRFQQRWNSSRRVTLNRKVMRGWSWTSSSTIVCYMFTASVQWNGTASVQWNATVPFTVILSFLRSQLPDTSFNLSCKNGQTVPLTLLRFFYSQGYISLMSTSSLCKSMNLDQNDENESDL